MRNDARYTMSIPVPIAVQNESWYNSWWNQNPEDETGVIDDADRWMDERRGEKDGPSCRFAEVEMGIG